MYARLFKVVPCWSDKHTGLAFQTDGRRGREAKVPDLAWDYVWR
jgi:hypothetical protein